MKNLRRHLFVLFFVVASAGPARSQDNSVEVAVYDTILGSVKPGQTTIEMGDMTVPVTTVKLWRDRLAGMPVPRSASQTGVNKWAGGVVYYSFNANVSAPRRTHFLDACAEWATFANLTFTLRTSQPNYVMVNDVPGLGGGNSAVGMIGGVQQLNIGSGSWNRGTLTHEIGHALGLIHEHQRSDRDAYVSILTANVPGGATDGNFIRIPISTHNGAYDFYSVMHYSRDALTINPGQDTIHAKPDYTQFQDIMGRNYLDRWLSRGDRDGIAAMYGAVPVPSLVVTNTKDSGPGSLRAALYRALDVALSPQPVVPVITFQIPVSDPNFSGGVFTIRPTDRLIGPGPAVVIDATTQTAFTGNTNAGGPEVVLNGASIATPESYGIGFRLGDNGSIVRGMVINGFSTQGILITGTNNRVEGCYIGTDAAGSAAVPNTFAGIEINGGATGNTVGGTTVTARNVISGNDSQGVFIRGAGTTGNVVSGNYVGTNASGTAAVGNGFAGVEIYQCAGNTVGGAAAGAGNVLSGNSSQGVAIIAADNNTVAGNFVGLNAAGTGALGNGFGGVQIFDGATGNTIGGSTPGARNVCSGNPTVGVSVSDAGSSGNVITGNYLGTNSAGTGAVPNGYSGASLYGGASENTVGPNNVISGNSFQGVLIADPNTDDNVVAGNLIGLNAAGSAALPNGWSGVELAQGAQGNTVGGFSVAARNVISGNTNQGVSLNGANTMGNRVAGNYIGTNAAGTAVMGNAWPGVEIFSGASANTIGGVESGAGNVISGNGFRGVTLASAGTNANVFAGNLIGLNAAGAAALPNAGPGFAIFGGAQNNVIGALSGGRNFIAGNNGSGFTISDTGTNGTKIIGNSIGVTPAGTVVANTSDGITIFGGAQMTFIGGLAAGSANLVRGNSGHGVAVYDATTSGIAIERNAIYENGGLGINLEGGSQNAARVTANDAAGDPDTGPNTLQNFPVITAATLGSTGLMVTGSLTSTANAAFRMDFYASPASDPSGNGEGRYYIGSLNGNTSGSGIYPINGLLPASVPAGYGITATATGAGNNTSEFSASRSVVTTDTDGDGMPNAWETQNGLLTGSSDAAVDFDSDGASNLDEFRAGTDPRNALSVLRPGPPVLTGGTLTFSFLAAPGKIYRVEYGDGLTGWSLLADQLYGGAPLAISDPGAGGALRRFYRVTVLPP